MSNIQLPEKLDFTDNAQWNAWISRFERYKIVSELSAKDEAVQVATLIYSMGEKAEDIFLSFNLNEDDKKNFKKVKEKFDDYFQPKVNPIFERAKLNMMTQRPGQTMQEHAVALKKQALRCGYKTPEIRDESTRDRFVVSILDSKISKKLQMDPELTLERAIQVAAQSEEVDRQQTQLNSKFSTDCVDRVGHKKTVRQHQQPKSSASYNRRPTNDADTPKRICKWCGDSKFHSHAECPARDKICNKCRKKGHFSRVCKSKPAVNNVETEERLFLGNVQKQPKVAENDFSVNLMVGSANVNFYIDTGADVNVIPKSMYKKSMMPPLVQSTQVLYGPEDNRLDVVGEFCTELKYGQASTTEKMYVIGSGRKALLGKDTSVKLQLVARINNVSQTNYHIKYKHMFQGLGKMEGKPCSIKLKANAEPKPTKAPRRIPIASSEKVEQELERMLNLGVIKKVSEPTEWCAPMVIVWKKTGAVRICVDYTDLNDNIVRDRTILPTVDEVLARLQNAKVFTKLDQNCGFWQVPLSEDSQLLTTFITPWGRYCFTRLPFGISIGPEYFQARMKEALAGCPGVEPLQDDTVVAGKDLEDHNKKLDCVMKALNKAGIRLNINKCEFAVKELKFLGHLVGENGIRPDPEKTDSINNYQQPKDTKELLRFLGMVNQLGKFIPNLSELSQPLRILLNKKVEWVWSHEQEQSFHKIKQALTSAPTLAFYSTKAETKLSTDSSSYGLGAVLLQRPRSTEEWRPVAYASRTLTNAETRYAQIEKEALGITWATEKFQDYLIGLKFTIETDHKPLVPIFTTKPIADLSSRLQRFRLRMMRYVYDIEYTPGTQLKTADALSRAPRQHSSSEIDLTDLDIDAHVRSVMLQLSAGNMSDRTLDDLREAQSKDTACIQLRGLIETSWPTHRRQLHATVQPFWPMRSELSVQENLVVRGDRIIIPESKRNEILSKLHEGHMGIEKTRQRASRLVWWPGMSAQIKSTVENCIVCLKDKPPATEPLIPTELPNYPWQMVGADLCQREKRDYLLITDYYSRFPEVMLLQSTTAQAVIQAIRSIFARHGIPQIVRSDNGPQFIAEAFSQLENEYGFTSITSSPRFPRSNGLIESSVKIVKRLISRAKDPYKALLDFRATPGPTGFSPAELLFGRQLRTAIPVLEKKLKPTQINDSWVRSKDFRNKLKMKKNFDKRHRATERESIPDDARVWITDLQREGIVIEKHATPRSYLVDTEKGVVRRNKQHLQVLPDHPTEDPNVVSSTEEPACPVNPPDIPKPSNQPDTRSKQPDIVTTSPTVTRYGRRIKPPDRLNL